MDTQVRVTYCTNNHQAHSKTVCLCTYQESQGSEEKTSDQFGIRPISHYQFNALEERYGLGMTRLWKVEKKYDRINKDAKTK